MTGIDIVYGIAATTPLVETADRMFFEMPAVAGSHSLPATFWTGVIGRASTASAILLQPIWATSGGSPAAVSVRSRVRTSFTATPCGLTVIFGCALAKASSSAWVPVPPRPAVP